MSAVGRSRAELDRLHLRAAVRSAALRVGAFVAAGLTEILFEAHLLALAFAAVAVLLPWPAREYADARIDGERFEVQDPGPPRALPS